MLDELTVEVIVRLFGEDPGFLPDCEVVGANGEDWPAVLDWVQANGWPALWQTEDGPVPLHVGRLLRQDSPTVAVHPADGVQLNFFIYPNDVMFDFDPREITDAPRAEALSEVIRGLGLLLGRDVVIQGLSGPEFARYDVTAGAFVLNPRS